MSEDIQFLKDLQQELKTQEHDYQASPRFWVIGDYEDEVTAKGYHDDIKFYNPDECESYTLDEAINIIKNSNIDPDEIDEALAEYESWGDVSKILECMEKIKSYIYAVYTTEKHVIKENTMFLTKQDAKDHLQTNKHHYTNKAHTYAMTAWRSPKVEKLFKILETFDWDSVKIYEEKL